MQESNKCLKNPLLGNMSKTKIVETFTGQSVSDFGTKLQNCAKLEFRKTDAQRKKHFAFRSTKIAQKFCEWRP